MVNTATLQVLAQMTYGNLQQSKVAPQLLQLIDQSPQGHVSELIQLPAGGGAVALPVPPNWTHVSQAVVCNMDTANYAVLQKAGGGALVGGNASTKASNTLSAIVSSAGRTFNSLTSTTINPGDFFVVNGVGLQSASPAPGPYQFTCNAPYNASTLQYLATVLNNYTNTTGVTAAYTNNDLVLTAANKGASGNLVSVAWGFDIVASGSSVYTGMVTASAIDQTLAPNGGISAESFAAGNPSGEGHTDPFTWTLRSCDSAGVLANGLATMVWCYLVGY